MVRSVSGIRSCKCVRGFVYAFSGGHPVRESFNHCLAATMYTCGFDCATIPEAEKLRRAFRDCDGDLRCPCPPQTGMLERSLSQSHFVAENSVTYKDAPTPET